VLTATVVAAICVVGAAAAKYWDAEFRFDASIAGCLQPSPAVRNHHGARSAPDFERPSGPASNGSRAVLVARTSDPGLSSLSELGVTKPQPARLEP
jgi:hypothetical protein